MGSNDITTARGDVLREGSIHWAIEKAVVGGFGVSNDAFTAREVHPLELLNHVHCTCCVNARWYVVREPGERVVRNVTEARNPYGRSFEIATVKLSLDAFRGMIGTYSIDNAADQPLFPPTLKKKPEEDTPK